MPDEKEIKKVGVMTKFVDDEATLNSFLGGIEFTIENLEHFNSETIRNVAYRYYSWESFAKDFELALRNV